jgi:hypothetical protein
MESCTDTDTDTDMGMDMETATETDASEDSSSPSLYGSAIVGLTIIAGGVSALL